MGLHVGSSAAERGKERTLDTMITRVVPSSKTFSYHLFSVFFVPGTGPGPFYLLFYLIFMTALQGH